MDNLLMETLCVSPAIICSFWEMLMEYPHDADGNVMYSPPVLWVFLTSIHIMAVLQQLLRGCQSSICAHTSTSLTTVLSLPLSSQQSCLFQLVVFEWQGSCLGAFLALKLPSTFTALNLREEETNFTASPLVLDSTSFIGALLTFKLKSTFSVLN